MILELKNVKPNKPEGQSKEGDGEESPSADSSKGLQAERNVQVTTPEVADKVEPVKDSVSEMKAESDEGEGKAKAVGHSPEPVQPKPVEIKKVDETRDESLAPSFKKPSARKHKSIPFVPKVYKPSVHKVDKNAKSNPMVKAWIGIGIAIGVIGFLFFYYRIKRKVNKSDEIPTDKFIKEINPNSSMQNELEKMNKVMNL